MTKVTTSGWSRRACLAVQIAALGFGAVWVAVLDEPTGQLITVRELIDGRDTRQEMPRISILDTRQPIGHGFRERCMINVKRPESLLILEEHPEGIPAGELALPRVVFEHLRGHPFACGPLLGSRGQPVGALGLSSYRGREALPDELFDQGLLRAFMSHLGIAMERVWRPRLAARQARPQLGDVTRPCQLENGGERCAWLDWLRWR